MISKSTDLLTKMLEWNCVLFFWWTAGYRKYSGIYWKNLTSDHSFKVSIFSQHLLHHKAALLFMTHCTCVHLMRASSIHFRKMATVRPSYKYIGGVCPVFSVGNSWWYINVNYYKLFFNSVLELISV